MSRFGISQPVRRREDVRFLTGAGRYIDDLVLPQMARAYLLRSPHAHARISRIDVADAACKPGVLAVITAADLQRDGIGEIPCVARPAVRAGSAYIEHLQPLLAADVVRYVGEGVAFVVAETVDQAKDAAQSIVVDYQELPVVVGCDRAVRPGAAMVWADAPNNTCFEWERGDAAATDAVFAAAADRVAIEVVNNRIVQSAIETRGAIGLWNAAEGKFTLHTVGQMPHPLKLQIAGGLFKLAPERVRVLVGDVGGGFGGKNSLYPEQGLVLYAARRLGRPVKWVGERSDAFVSDFHGRDNVTRGELALDQAGRFLAIRVSTLADLGAYVASRGPISPTSGTVMLSNTYRIPSIYAEVRAVYSHTVPTDPYRGAGRPEVLYLVERLIDAAARQIGVDRVELRRRNCIPPEAFPYQSPTGLSYDAADFSRIIDTALREADWAGFERRRKEAARRGKLRGIGMSNYIERCGGGAGLNENARLRFDADGVVTLLIGSMSNGQGHETAYSQIISDRLGLPFEKIRILQGDTDRIASGTGTGGSWSMTMGGGAVALAADKIVARARRLASHILEAAEADLQFDDGRFTVAGTDLGMSLETLAGRSFDPAQLPPGSGPGLDEEHRFTPENYTFPYGCHICELEVDAETGATTVVAYTAAHDFGRALNPMLLAGQVHGGVAQGIGQALFEHTVYDEAGQLQSGSFMDYCLPRADDLPSFNFVMQETPSSRNALGVKGCGEAGATGSPPAVINALLDALAPLGVRHIDMPATPERVWQAMRATASRG